MKGFTRYQKLVAHHAKNLVIQITEQQKRGENKYFDENSFFGKVFYGFNEITNTLESMKLSLALVSLSPPRSKKIKKDDYIKYHINAYLHENYILKERLNSYATTIERAYKKTSKHPNVKRCIEPLFELIKESFNGIVVTRGKHVHSKRYSDDNLDRLSTFSLVAEHDGEFEKYAYLGYKQEKEKWIKTMKDNNKTIMNILDVYFDTLYLLITDNEKITEPNK